MWVLLYNKKMVTTHLQSGPKKRCYLIAALSMLIANLLSMAVVALPENNPSAQAVKWYQVDVIFFLHQQDETNLDETGYTVINSHDHWPPPKGSNQTVSYHLLPSSAFLLKQATRQLNKQDDYKIISHIAWKEPVTSTGKTKTFYFTGGEIYNSLGDAIEPNYQPLNPSQAQHPQLFHQIEAAFEIKQQRYITVKAFVKLLYPTNRLPFSFDRVKEEDDNLLAPKGYRLLSLKQTVSMRDNQINYFDHPFFGVLIKMTPL